MSKLGNIRVRKNSGAIVGNRRLINLIEGANVTLTVTDDAPGDEVDVTVAAAAAGGTIFANKNGGAAVGPQPELSFIEGANITLTVADDPANNEIDITIASAGGASSVWVDQFFPYPQADNHKGAYAAGLMPDTIDTEVYQTFYIPDDIATIDTAVIVIIPEGTGNLRWQCDTDFATCGEDFETHQDNIGATTTAVTNEENECIDISAALTGATGGDIVGIQFIRTASHVDDTVDADCYYVGILIKGSIGE